MTDNTFFGTPAEQQQGFPIHVLIAGTSTYGQLTTDHPASSHNQPVLVVDGNAYGYGDRVPVHVVNPLASTEGITPVRPYLYLSGRSEHADPEVIARWNSNVERAHTGVGSDFDRHARRLVGPLWDVPLTDAEIAEIEHA